MRKIDFKNMNKKGWLFLVGIVGCLILSVTFLCKGIDLSNDPIVYGVKYKVELGEYDSAITFYKDGTVTVASGVDAKKRGLYLIAEGNHLSDAPNTIYIIGFRAISSTEANTSTTYLSLKNKYTVCDGSVECKANFDPAIMLWCLFGISIVGLGVLINFEMKTLKNKEESNA